MKSTLVIVVIAKSIISAIKGANLCINKVLVFSCCSFSNCGQNEGVEIYSANYNSQRAFKVVLPRCFDCFCSSQQDLD